MKYIDLTKIYDKYAGKWVALSKDLANVLASGKSLQEAYVKAVQKGQSSPTVFKVPAENILHSRG